MNKPGIKTSEFWVIVVSAVSTMLMNVFGLDLDPEALAMVWGPAAAYVVSRGLAKVNK